MVCAYNIVFSKMEENIIQRLNHPEGPRENMLTRFNFDIKYKSMFTVYNKLFEYIKNRINIDHIENLELFRNIFQETLMSNYCLELISGYACNFILIIFFVNFGEDKYKINDIDTFIDTFWIKIVEDMAMLIINFFWKEEFNIIFRGYLDINLFKNYFIKEELEGSVIEELVSMINGCGNNEKLVKDIRNPYKNPLYEIIQRYKLTNNHSEIIDEIFFELVTNDYYKNLFKSMKRKFEEINEILKVVVTPTHYITIGFERQFGE